MLIISEKLCILCGIDFGEIASSSLSKSWAQEVFLTLSVSIREEGKFTNMLAISSQAIAVLTEVVPKWLAFPQTAFI